jgi:protein TonB
MLKQGLPYSIFVHALGLVLVVMFGNHVARNPVQPPRSIKVKMVRMEQTAPPQAKPATETVKQVAQPEIKPDLPPKELPQPKPEIKKVEQKPQPEIKVAEPEPEVVEKKAEPIEQVVARPAMTTPTIGGTDENFPYAWYISLIEGKVVNNWKPRQLGFGKRAIVSCTVHFRVARNGTVSQVTLVRNSGVGVFDRESLRAVKTTKLPPLPPQYKGASLGITFIFNLEPGK